MSEDVTHIEKELLTRVSRGDEKAFTQLLVETSGLLYSFILRHTKAKELAEEIVQDIFTQIWQTRESLTEIKNFQVYLYVISRNRMLNEIKKMIRERKRHQEWKDAVIADVREEDAAVIEQQYNLIDNAIAQLPPQQKKVWILNRQKKLTYKEIAAEMNISRETVKTYLQHANNTIAKYISVHPDL